MHYLFHIDMNKKYRFRGKTIKIYVKKSLYLIINGYL